MGINKGTIDRFVKEKLPFEIISREVVQSINDPVALAIWTYLMTLPDNWIPRRQQILDQFDGLGRDRYDKAMTLLRERNLVWVAVTRNDQGQIIDRVMVAEATPKKDDLKSDFPQVGNTALRETPPLKEEDITKETINTCPSDGFDEFWSLYPRRSAKKKAQQIWRNMTKKKRQAAIAHISANPYLGTDPQYIPMPTTYLNQERFEDEVTFPSNGKQYGGSIL